MCSLSLRTETETPLTNHKAPTEKLLFTPRREVLSPTTHYNTMLNDLVTVILSERATFDVEKKEGVSGSVVWKNGGGVSILAPE